MKKFWLVLVVILVLFAIFFWSTKSEKVTNYPSQNSGVVAFGDSLVEGVGSSGGGGFVKMISLDLNLEIANLGVSGNTTADALRRIQEVTERKPSVTILLIGANDFLRKVPKEETVKNLQEIITRLHESGSVVVLVGVEPIIIRTDAREIFESISGEYGTAYVSDILDGILGHQSLLSDGLHPNDVGYRLMADRIKPTLKRVLR